jgi:hypothetical protein
VAKMLTDLTFDAYCIFTQLKAYMHENLHQWQSGYGGNNNGSTATSSPIENVPEIMPVSFHLKLYRGTPRNQKI